MLTYHRSASPLHTSSTRLQSDRQELSLSHVSEDCTLRRGLLTDFYIEGILAVSIGMAHVILLGQVRSSDYVMLFVRVSRKQCITGALPLPNARRSHVSCRAMLVLIPWLRLYLLNMLINIQIAIDSAIFPEGTTGAQLDVLARRALWKDGWVSSPIFLLPALIKYVLSLNYLVSINLLQLI